MGNHAEWSDSGVEQRNAAFEKWNGCIEQARLNSEPDVGIGLEGSKIKRFFRRVLGKVLFVCYGWYIVPKQHKQTGFNQNMIEAAVQQQQLNVKNNLDVKAQIKALQDEVEALKEELCTSKMEAQAAKEEMDRLNHEVQRLGKDPFSDLELDYFAFENKFRGKAEDVKRIQKDFVKFFADKQGTILDIGCGRGEFLELLQDEGIPAIGIDVYTPFVQYCNEKGLNVKGGDALEVLKTMEDDSLGGVMMSHVVEHLKPDYIMELMRVVRQKLQTGGCFIMQTPNPQALFTFIDFYVDITHIKPVHYRALEFMFEQQGYSRIERFDPPGTKFHDVVVQLYEDNSRLNLEQFNYGMNNLNEYLTGYQDYAIVAYK